jgi:hypothetical protein
VKYPLKPGMSMLRTKKMEDNIHKNLKTMTVTEHHL